MKKIKNKIQRLLRNFSDSYTQKRNFNIFNTFGKDPLLQKEKKQEKIFKFIFLFIPKENVMRLII